MRYIPNEDLEQYTDPEGNVSFVSIIKEGTDLTGIICDAYNSSYIGNQEITERNEDNIDDNYYYDNIEYLENGDVLIKYNINFSEILMFEEYNSSETFLDRFTNYMVKSTVFTWVFSDEQYRNNMRFLYQDIYNLEMKLREILSYIYVKECYPKLESFHKKIKRKRENIKPGENKENIIDETAKLGENIFFRFIFSDYKKIAIHGLIKQEKNLSFLNSISDDLEIIEKIRNGLMHFRKLSNDDIENYKIASNDLIYKINDFEPFGFDEYGLIEGEEYESLKDLKNFKKGKKYKLKSWDRRTAVFIGEGGVEVPFRDKELTEYFKYREDYETI